MGRHHANVTGTQRSTRGSGVGGGVTAGKKYSKIIARVEKEMTTRLENLERLHELGLE